MCFFTHLWRMLQIYTATILTIVTVSQEFESRELSDSMKSPSSFPVNLPVSYQITNANSFFFLKEISQDIMRNSSMQIHTEPFVILKTSQPPVISASYGPLSVEQTVPLHFMQTADLFRTSTKFTFDWKIQSYILTQKVYSSTPKMRILFYISGRDWEAQGTEGAMDDLPCVIVYAFWQTQEVRSSCSIKGDLGICVAELEPVLSWFSPASETTTRERPDQSEGNSVELYYTARPNANGGCSSEDVKKWGRTEQYESDDGSVTPMQRIGSVRLFQVPQSEAYLTQLKLGEAIVIQTSSKPLKKTDIATFSVFVSSGSAVDKFILRAVIKKNVSFLNARPSNSVLWEINLQKEEPENDGTITMLCQKKSDVSRKRPEDSLVEILQLDFEAEELSGHAESQGVTWQLEYPGSAKPVDEGVMPIYTTRRDFVGLAPLVMDTEILNTAVLTGKKVMVPVRVVAVEEDSSATDVSDFADCRSSDDDVLKVSDRCDYVFVNGKEMRGKVRITVNFFYGYLSAQLEMTVWIPRLPLQIEVSDTELSQIKGWRVPISTSKRPSWESDEEEEDRKGRGCMLQYQHALVRVFTHFVAEQSDPREQLAYFLGPDWQVDITELVRYFLKVEDPRIARLQAGRILAGRDVGVTTIQVLSPLSDSILAEKTVTVLDDKVAITELGVQLVTGLSLSLQLSPGSNRAIIATATTQELLHSPKQEAQISSWIQFSDGSMSPLDIYDSSYYMLSVTSLDEAVVSVRQDPSERFPVVLAEGEGQGAAVKVEMVISEVCQKSKRKSTLAVGSGSVRVSFHPSARGNKEDRSSDYGNDGEELENRKNARKQMTPSQGMTGTDGRFYGSSLSDREESAMRKITTTAKSVVRDVAMGSISSGAGWDHSNIIGYTNFPSQVDVPRNNGAEVESDLAQTPRSLTDLEIGMYALLGVFCLAILVFLLNCVSYVLKFRRKQAPVQGQDTVSHMHDWVWLGTDAELVMNMPGTPSQHEKHNTTVIDIGLGLENGANLVSGAVQQTDPMCGSMQSIRAKHKNESLNSPTTKRKRVKFTTFTSISLDNRLPSTDSALKDHEMDIKWVGQEENCVESKVVNGELLDHL
ncbi:transmembrane protein 132D-like [Lepisosteus oculatus]|uniref:Transmembrane protein 132C-like n=1 Tax=Lepisosteus oculatus TaxID=7918 RepID=W5MGW1_LEPOC|nr:PREDICTED: transmembrane protein 132D-like isoform X2 [Lepisosteus oculatus]